MLRKYVSSFVGMRYITIEFFIAAAILISSFLYSRYDLPWLRYVLIIGSIAIVVIMLLYAKDRYITGKELDKIKKQKEYSRALNLGFAFLLENRMAIYQKGHVMETTYTDLTDARMITGKRGKQAVLVTKDGKEWEIQIGTTQQGERLAAFLRAKNPDIKLHDLKTKGNGSFRSVDLVPAEKQTLGA